MPRLRSRSTNGGSNALALCISALSLGGIFLSFDPAPAGEHVADIRRTIPRESDVPVPPGLILSEITQPAGPSVAAEGSSPAAGQGIVLSNQEAIHFSLLLLKDAARFLENVDSYSVTFNKQERINGDLGESQIIDLKVRHQPSFSVYMKWRNGDRGRQVLYNEDYNDKKMVVKLGGFKGRLLPAIKLDPRSPEAMSEARYPCTEAGLLGMVRQLVMHREKDVAHGQGVTCIRLPNRICDERDCYCFQYEYASAEFNEIYRKSLVLIDTRYHIPLQVINYTWAQDVDGLTPQELDEQTLVENYSFQTLDFGRQLVVEDFSRDNPTYRM